MTSWHDKHVFVTGGSSGIGLSVASQAARRGAHVSIVARDRDRLEAARESVANARVSREQHVRAYAADVASYEAIEAAVRAASAASGPIDILVTCAGYCHPARFIDQSPEQLRDQVDVNLIGTMYTVRAVAPSMVERDSGSISMVSSLGGLIGVYGYGGYSPAKFGVVGLGEVLRNELKPHGISVSVVCPPNVDTPGYAREVAIEPPETARINGSARAVSPDAMAELLVDAIDRRRFMVVPGIGTGVLRRMKGLAPEPFHMLFDHHVASVRKEARGDA